HRDLKPSNLIRRYKDCEIVLIDFGAVKQISAPLMDSPDDTKGDTNLTIAIGSPGYMPNEQLAGTPQFSSDIYAV
ncbi:MAG TPA: serine/threonine protein kinase, partial [Cyanobacteria bacterium UBA11148]|nr:serine/threonine protein kinase [Cyanobacteria bacterium UBA11148]